MSSSAPLAARTWSSWWAPLGLSRPHKRSRTGSDGSSASTAGRSRTGSDGSSGSTTGPDLDEGAGAPLLVCDRLEDWLRPEGEQHQGLLLRRRPTWGDVQAAVEAAAASGVFGRDDCICASAHRTPRGDFEDFGAVAEGLVSQVGCLPDEIAAVIVADARAIGMTLAQLCPWSKQMDVKLEIMGENRCARWHKDSYSGRAIVSYNSRATEYTPLSNVNKWELENRGENDRIIHDQTQVFSADLGDFLFMKGKVFPSPVNGLIHRSPEKQYDASGNIISRLVLKLDIP